MEHHRFSALFEGVNVLFITPSDRDYIRNKQELRLIEERANSVTVIAPKPTGHVRPTTFLRALIIMVRALFHNKRGYDVIFVGGLPQAIVPFIAPFIKKKRLVVDFFISLYDTIVYDRKRVRETSFIAKVLLSLDKATANAAETLVCDTNAHGLYFADMFGVAREKVVPLYLEADTALYAPRRVARKPEWEGKYIVFFFGAMNPLQGVEYIFRAAALLEREKRIHFVFVGPTAKVAGIDDYRGLPNVEIISSWLGEKEIAEYIAQADLCLAGHFSADVKKASRVIPGKAYIYRAMGKPVVLGENAANRERFSEEDAGVFFVPMGDETTLANVIRIASEGDNDE